MIKINLLDVDAWGGSDEWTYNKWWRVASFEVPTPISDAGIVQTAINIGLLPKLDRRQIEFEDVGVGIEIREKATQRPLWQLEFDEL